MIFCLRQLQEKCIEQDGPLYIVFVDFTKAVCLLCVTPISKTCANSFFDRSFVYAAPTLWNALDLDIRLLPFDKFKKSVKTHLYLKYFVN